VARAPRVRASRRPQGPPCLFGVLPKSFARFFYRLATRIGGAQVLPLCMPVLSRGAGGPKMFLHC
jgi:hypothetical protein